MNNPGIVESLRNSMDLTQTIEDAADMLEFFMAQMQCPSIQMNGKHRFIFRSSGWPMTHCVGPNAEEAVMNVIKEIRRERIVQDE